MALSLSTTPARRLRRGCDRRSCALGRRAEHHRSFIGAHDSGPFGAAALGRVGHGDGHPNGHDPRARTGRVAGTPQRTHHCVYTSDCRLRWLLGWSHQCRDDRRRLAPHGNAGCGNGPHRPSSIGRWLRDPMVRPGCGRIAAVPTAKSGELVVGLPDRIPRRLSVRFLGIRRNGQSLKPSGVGTHSFEPMDSHQRLVSSVPCRSHLGKWIPGRAVVRGCGADRQSAPLVPGWHGRHGSTVRFPFLTLGDRRRDGRG